MSVSAPSPGIRQPVHPERAAHDLTVAWEVVAVMIAMVAAMPLVGSFDWEPSFVVSAVSFGLFVLVLAALGTTSIRFGLRARDEGRDSGLLAATIGGTIAGLFLLLALAVLVGHLFGFE